MLVKGWMNTDVLTVREDSALEKAYVIMKEKGIRTLPVVNKKGRLIGIVTDRDLKDASPSKATTLYDYEQNCLISGLKIKDIMSRDLVFVRPDETVEFAATLMLVNKISSLPVIKDDDSLVGVITQTDIFSILMTITGADEGGVQFAFSLEDNPDSVKKLTESIRNSGGNIASILSTKKDAEEGRQNVYIRIDSLVNSKARTLAKALQKDFLMLYSVCDNTKEVEARSARACSREQLGRYKKFGLRHDNKNIVSKTRYISAKTITSGLTH